MGYPSLANVNSFVKLAAVTEPPLYMPLISNSNTWREAICKFIISSKCLYSALYEENGLHLLALSQFTYAHVSVIEQQLPVMYISLLIAS